MEEQLYRIVSAGEGLFKDRGSRFLSFAFPLREQGEIDHHLQTLRKQYYDARHHCTAYRLGSRGETSYANDDGEPSHSAGTPILGAIRSLSLTDTLVVVVRYFGGTKLGVRGLIDAYRSAAELALENAAREAIIHKVFFELQFAYDRTTALNRILHPFGPEVVSADYTESCRQTLAIEEERFAQLQASLEREQFIVNVMEDHE